jgi:ribosomal protein S6
MPKKKTKENPTEQLEDFKRLAREAGADIDKADDEVMRRLAKQKRHSAEPSKK